MTSETPIPEPLPAGELLRLLKVRGSDRTEFNSILLISLDVLPIVTVEESFWASLDEMMGEFSKRQHATIYRVTQTERAALVKITEFNQINIITDLKLELLRLIQRYFPQYFGMIDQSRLIRNIDLRVKLDKAIKYLEHRIAEAADGSEARHLLRPLRENDIDKVAHLHEKVGKSEFSKVFIRNQPITVIKPGERLSDVMNEFYVAMDALRQHVFKEVELRGSGNLFNHLTITLDRILLDSFADANPNRMSCSVNLNVESVFTNNFERFTENLNGGDLSNIVFEFRQSNIVQHFDEFEVAANLITSKNGAIAVDQIFPETIGVVNIERLHAKMAKIYWRSGAETILPQVSDVIERLHGHGVLVVLARVDEDVAVELGQSLGINLFQGFYVDKLLQYQAETA